MARKRLYEMWPDAVMVETRAEKVEKEKEKERRRGREGDAVLLKTRTHSLGVIWILQTN